MGRHVLTEEQRREAAWEQNLREQALRNLRRALRRERRERLQAQLADQTPAVAGRSARVEHRRQPL